eukprot:1152531-Pelagomonas_calceolata.AAC.1
MERVSGKSAKGDGQASQGLPHPHTGGHAHKLDFATSRVFITRHLKQLPALCVDKYMETGEQLPLPLLSVHAQYSLLWSPEHACSVQPIKCTRRLCTHSLKTSPDSGCA